MVTKAFSKRTPWAARRSRCGRLQIRMPGAPQVIPTVVVGQDENDIGGQGLPPGRGGRPPESPGGPGQGECSQGFESRTPIHAPGGHHDLPLEARARWERKKSVLTRGISRRQRPASVRPSPVWPETVPRILHRWTGWPRAWPLSDPGPGPEAGLPGTLRDPAPPHRCP